MPTTSRPADPQLLPAAKAASERPAHKRPAPEIATRALAEAAARRAEHENTGTEKTKTAGEVGGRGGLDPTRYGDWEINGLASDF